MPVQFIRTFESIEASDEPLVGGKGLSLGMLTRAGLPVPPGFCLSTDAYRIAQSTMTTAVSILPLRVHGELADAYEALGGGLVAVRSSALGEDGEAASFAGQQETLLGVKGASAVAMAVSQCWQSLHSERARAYRQIQGGSAALAMAVVVQRLVEAEVSGVLFTRDPLDADGKRMLVEAAWGLGESVVSGRVTPDRYCLDHQSGRLLKQQVNTKAVETTLHGVRPVAEERQNQPCLSAGQLEELAELGRRIEAYYRSPRDIEWAWAEGRFWILQARPITTAGAFEREEVRRKEIAALPARAEPKGTVWARYNLAEILPTPTPMTWAIVRRFMSGRGGYGLMLRDLGFDPDPIIDTEGFIDLICGRPYVNLSREPRLYFCDFPSGHSFAALKSNPEKAFYPQPVPDSERVTGRFLLRLPAIFFKMLRNASRMRRQAETHAWHLRRVVFPGFLADVAVGSEEDLEGKSGLDLVTYLCHWINRTLNAFARESLRPSVFAAVALANLEQAAKKVLEPERAVGLARSLLGGVHPEPEGDLAGALRDFAEGRRTLEQTLAIVGCRGPQEMELSQPRWSESPQSLAESVQGLGSGPATPRFAAAGEEGARGLWEYFVQEAKLDSKRAARLRREFERARDYSALRETGKHYLMMGYALIRRALLEFDRRFELRGGVFFLEPEELPRLVKEEDLREVIARRRQERTLALSLEVPAVLFSDDLDAIGRPIAVSGAAELQGTPLSQGIAEGPALVLLEPQPVDHCGGEFILVCPSTDPAWVPLFLKAKGLLMETGGVLSHGAIVAREFGLPAVAGIPGIQQRLCTGQRIRIDGNSGKVHVFE